MLLKEFDEKKVVDEITDFIKETYDEAGAEKLVVGISGGVDSSVTAALCKRAVGGENVLGISLPISKENELPKRFADSININYEEVNISSEFNQAFNTLSNKCRHFDGDRVSLGNVKARLRMIFLYYHANELDGLVVGTGNKSEIQIGYFTKHGDGAADFFPIGDLYKTQVYDVAEYLDLSQEVIEKEPSAGLWEGQTDEDEIGLSYSVLDEILFGLEKGMKKKEIKEEFGHSLEEINEVIEQKKCSEHKRKKAPIFGVF